MAGQESENTVWSDTFNILIHSTVHRNNQFLVAFNSLFKPEDQSYLKSSILCYIFKCLLFTRIPTVKELPFVSFIYKHLILACSCFRILVEHSRGTARGFSGGRKSRARDK